MTLNTLVQGAWALLLSRYSGADDVVFGVTVAGRPPELTGVETMVGLFINTLPVRVRLAAPQLVGGLAAAALQSRQLELQRFDGTPAGPGAALERACPAGSRSSRACYVFENYPVDGALRSATTDAR